jgi:hypothetical protein
MSWYSDILAFHIASNVSACAASFNKVAFMFERSSMAAAPLKWFLSISHKVIRLLHCLIFQLHNSTSFLTIVKSINEAYWKTAGVLYILSALICFHNPIYLE